MKISIILTLSLILYCCQLWAKTKKETKLYELYSRIELTSYLTKIKKIKKFQTISHIDKLDYELKPFYKNLKSWHYFDINDFKRGLTSKLKKSLTENEIDLINKKFLNPFLVKFLNSLSLKRNIFLFHQSVLDEKFTFKPFTKSRVALIKSLYNLHGLEIQNDNVFKRLSELHKSKALLINMLADNKKTGVFLDPSMIEQRLNQTKELVYNSIGESVADYRHYEVREYLRVMQSKTIQKFLQLYTNYHFLYISKYVRKIETDKINQLKLLKVNE